MIFAVGLCVLLYPTVSNLWNQHRQNRLIDNYTNTVAELREDEKSDVRSAAEAYNNTLAGFSTEASLDHDSYNALLNLDGSGIMGYLEVPKINVRLAIYHGTSEAAPDNGVGHLEGTSLPVGGSGTHCVLSGHRGLPSAKLFTDLDKLENGDQFYIYIMGEVLAYEVDQISVVEPTQVDALRIIPDQDYVTLLTCTPYGVNSHRLLVRGHRTEYVPETSDDKYVPKDGADIDLWVIIPVALVTLLLLALAVFKVIRRKK
jgi:sortase A